MTTLGLKGKRRYVPRLCFEDPALIPVGAFSRTMAGADTVDKESVFANYKSVFSRQFAVSLAVEFLGVMFFQILGGAPETLHCPHSPS